MKLDRKEFCFEKVATAEVYPCCLWEYLRECQTVLDLLREFDPNKPIIRWEVRMELASHSKILQAVLLDDLLDALTNALEPWLALPRQTRKRLARFWPTVESRHSYKRALTFAPPDPHQSGFFDRATWDEFFWLAKPYLELLNSSCNTTDRDFYPKSRIFLGQETGAFTIDWTRKTDDIVASFRIWLEANRPKEISQADGRGHNLNHYYVALRRLGIMRRLFHDPAQGNSEWNKEARRALKHFTAFVRRTNGEKPIHWPEFLGTK
ncbi:MAG: hypothetical protein HY735_19205 [Verrucomicrobia bacterium]|nr:hypothetical protein [Verrucomicrobiota bacterium]